MSDFLNKTWTLDEDCLDKEVLNECYQQQHLFDQSATTSKCSNDIDNVFNKLFQNNNASFLLFDEDLTGFELENGDPICNEIPLSNNNNNNKITINKQSLSNVNNQTINIDYDYEETTDLIEINSNNLNVTINIQQQQQQQQQQTEIKNKLNITVNIDDLDNDLPLAATTETTAKEKLNVTIEIKEKKLKSIENEQIPKTLDLFTQDLNKQSSSSHSPNALSSSSSSSCSSLSSSCSFSKHNINNKNYTGRLPVSSKLANYKSTNLRILTSSVDKDLNKMTTNAQLLPKPSIKTVPRTVTHGLPQSVRTSSSIPSGIKTAITTTTTTTNNNNKRKSMIKKSGLPVSPSSNINNVTIDIGDENKLTRTSSIVGSKKTTVDLFNDIEASNIIQPIQLHNAFAQTSIPKSFDMFADDINKQTIIQLPSSSAGPSSSSCSSLASSSSSSLSLGSSNRYSLNRPSGILSVGNNNKLLEYKSKFKILTSSIDKDLNKITNNNDNSNNKQEEIVKTKPSVVKSTIPIARPNSSGIPVPKSFIPKPTSISGVLRNSTNNNIGIIKVSKSKLQILLWPNLNVHDHSN